MRLCLVLVLGLLARVEIAHASDAMPDRPVNRDFQAGDCVVFREGGAGLILKTPTYWVKGRISAVSRERKLTGRCPLIAKPVQAYSHDDWVLVVSAAPCVDDESDRREVPVVRVQVAVDAWETPWSYQHGTVGWLFRGQFLDKPLKKDGLIEMDPAWLDRCESQI